MNKKKSVEDTEKKMETEKASTETTIANLAGSGNELVFANDDGTLKRAAGISLANGSLTVANNLTVNGSTTLNTVVKICCRRGGCNSHVMLSHRPDTGYHGLAAQTRRRPACREGSFSLMCAWG